MELPGALSLDPRNPSLAIAIPCEPLFFGTTLYVQGFTIDAAANALGVAASNGISITIGNDEPPAKEVLRG